MGIWNALTGKNHRDNQVSDAATARAFATYQGMCIKGLNGTSKAFALALVMTVSDSAKHMFCDLKIREYVAIGKKADPAVLERFTAYLAWFLLDRWTSLNRELFFDEGAEEDTSGAALLADMQLTREALFPTSASMVKGAIERLKANNERGLGDGSDAALLRWNEEFWLILNDLLGLPKLSPGDSIARMERTLAIARVQSSALRVFSEFFEKLVNNPER